MTKLSQRIKEYEQQGYPTYCAHCKATGRRPTSCNDQTEPCHIDRLHQKPKETDKTKLARLYKGEKIEL